MTGRAGAAAILLGLLASSWTGGGANLEPLRRPPHPPAAAQHLRATGATPAARLAPTRGGRLAARTGEQVNVVVSTVYPPEAVSAQAWADFFAGLLHGDELGRVRVRILTPPEVARVCGSRALGCYGAGDLVMPGEPVSGVTPEEVARHEYGHHVAASRPNPPWRSVDRGPKRWSSAVDVCARTAAGQLFPGDEGVGYRLNPGEGFAEAYRVVDERRAGLASTWSIVDAGFLPDARAAAAIEEDVLHPWAAPATRTIRTRLRAPAWRLRLEPPLDGTLTVTVALPPGRLDLVELRADGGRTVVATGLWSGAATKTLTYEICGRRPLELRVVRRGRPGPLTVSVSLP